MMVDSPDDVLTHRRFGVDDQRWFAEASGDHNPLHMDEVVARRSIYGRTVVHGVHALLWGLDAFLAARETSVERIAVTFRRPIFLDEDVQVVVVREDDRRAEVQIRHGSIVLLAARFDLAPTSQRYGGPLLVPEDAPEVPGLALEVDTDTIADASGHIPAHQQQRALAPVFAAAVAALGEDTVALISSLSRLVGMECPGLHSLFTSFEVVVAVQEADEGLSWTVARFDERLAVVRMEVRGPTLRGTVDAFVRPRPVEQLASAKLRRLVETSEFEGMRALVVGGSRGLGEVTAKLVAAGGGHPIVTWHRGEREALAVVDDIRGVGGTATAMQLDVAWPGTELALAEPAPTHLFYFATPPIGTRRTASFDEDLFRGFLTVYVTGFIGIVRSLQANGATRLAAFYPSTIFVEEPSGFAEYAAAKAAGEIAVRAIAEQEPDLQVLVERLPRLRTDQTASVLAASAEAPEHLMLEQIRRLAALG